MSSIKFKNEGNSFDGYYAAEKYLKENGYIMGSMQSDEPIGFAPASEYGYIAKWGNISREDRNKLHGVMKSDDFRNGGVELVFYK